MSWRLREAFAVMVIIACGIVGADVLRWIMLLVFGFAIGWIGTMIE